MTTLPQQTERVCECGTPESTHSENGCLHFVHASDRTVSRVSDVLPFLRQRDDTAFTAPGNVHKMQTDESIVVLRLAQHLADLAYNRELAELPRAERALCRALACQAVRLTSKNWQDAALSDAMKACVRWMQTEGGKAFRDLSEPHLEAIAVMLVPYVLTAYKGISEGSVPLTAGRYLAINEGRGL